MKKSAILVLFVAFLTSSCLTGKKLNYFGQESSLPENIPYKRALKDWLREDENHEGWIMTISARTVLLSLDYRRARMQKIADAEMLTDEERESRWQEEVTAFNEHIQFLCAVATDDEDVNDLNNPESLWQIYLRTDRNYRLEPTEIKVVDIDPRETLALYPFMNKWQKVYLLSFPRKFSESGELLWNERTRKLELVITGVSGRVSLNWYFTQG